LGDGGAALIRSRGEMPSQAPVASRSVMGGGTYLGDGRDTTEAVSRAVIVPIDDRARPAEQQRGRQLVVLVQHR
jgi:hypothetical protein